MKFIVALCLLFALIHAKPLSDEADKIDGKTTEEVLYDSDETEKQDKTTQKIVTKVKYADAVKEGITSEPTTEAALEDDFSKESSKEEVAETSKETSTTTEEPSTTTPKNSAHNLTNSHLMTALSILLVIFTIKF